MDRRRGALGRCRLGLWAVLAVLPVLAGCDQREGQQAAAAPAAAAVEAPAVEGQAEAAEGAPAAVEEEAEERDARWAVPMDEPGLPNLHKVADGLYRSAQPTAEGMKRAKELGIKTVVNLRSLHSDRDEIGETALAYEHIRMKAWHPEDEDVVRFLQIALDPARQPVLVHCQHGADRTGTICAAYRVAVEGWSVEDAVEEMTEGGYGFHDIWQGTLPVYLRALNFGDIRRRVGLSEEEPAEQTGDEKDAE
jgi:protein tyrosine phosphatase (PTP) superfamily phosphohydrolase (DUF442 family)